MNLSETVNRLMINPRKLTHYALDPDSPRGKHKAVLFRKLLGFTKENYVILMQQLKDKCWEAEGTFHSEDQFGKRYTVDVLIEGTAGQQHIVRTGWIVPPETQEAHLVTVYVKKR